MKTTLTSSVVRAAPCLPLMVSFSLVMAACGGTTPAPRGGGAAGTGGHGGAAGLAASGQAGSAGDAGAFGGAGVSGGAGAPGAGTAGAGSAGAGGAAGRSFDGGAGGTSASGGGQDGGGSAGRDGGGAGADAGTGAAGTAGTSCPASDPLKTNNAKVDAYDCVVLAECTKWGMPDPMIVKSQIQQESSFNEFAVSPDSPCGIMQGWTDAESKSFGLIQTTPACGEAKSALLSNGHPNLTKDMTSALWATSVFNPTINLDEGIKTDVDSLKALKAQYPGCTAAQYNMMAAGAFNSGTGAISGCGRYNARAQAYVDAITSHYHQYAASAGWPDPY
ncbi:MAG TPA: transglycosylase SLT domain-containing protein [Polyangia bacterium]|nr:transglycosylase SLT domain-containing protein [Polyangia bacterium]